MRPGLIAELLRTRRVNNSHNLVFVTHGLAVVYEPALLALFSPAELGVLRNAHRDYAGQHALSLPNSDFFLFTLRPEILSPSRRDPLLQSVLLWSYLGNGLMKTKMTPRWAPFYLPLTTVGELGLQVRVFSFAVIWPSSR